ncbi:MAG: MotA/TolQ/ExbB proton channel family protein [Thermodesulfobacteriota bacterium]|nr:MotA/TolQ/ExbB proton channel family protein [Thermodesulfobacteriota bacterium]
MVYDLFVKGGPIMWPLLVCSLVSVTVIIERAIFWWRQDKRRTSMLVEEILRHTEEGNFEGATSIGSGISDVVVRVLTSALVHKDDGPLENMQIAAQDEIEEMKRGMGVLDTIITMAPLLGILGTVIGIIESFNLLGLAGIEEPRAVVGGVAQALITTAAGLSVALITLIPFNYLITKVDKAAKHLEKITARFEVAYKKGMKRCN